jgi:hypothetical protein
MGLFGPNIGKMSKNFDAVGLIDVYLHDGSSANREAALEAIVTSGTVAIWARPLLLAHLIADDDKRAPAVALALLGPEAYDLVARMAAGSEERSQRNALEALYCFAFSGTERKAFTEIRRLASESEFLAVRENAQGASDELDRIVMARSMARHGVRTRPSLET